DLYVSCVTTIFFFFFFQAEDGIRDFHVTGVQTCALPISPATVENRANISVCFPISLNILALVYCVMSWVTVKVPKAPDPLACIQIGRASCRERVAIFSRNQKSCINIGPLGPAVCTF